MNRKEEFEDLKNTLEQTPAELDYIVTRAVKRAKHHKHQSILWKAPVLSFCSIILLFILLVNLFPKAALAMSNVPILRDLVAAAAFDPSLKLAVENDYYQMIGESQTKDDVTVTVEYMILDAGHISIFFKVDAPVEAGIYHFNLLNGDRRQLAAALVFDTMYEAGKLEEIQIEFTDPDTAIPDKILFNITINKTDDFHEFKEAILPEDGESPAIENNTTDGIDYDFSFELIPNEKFTGAVTTVSLQKWISIKGQRIYLDCLNIYPTKTRLYLDCDTDNSAVLDELLVYFKDENGIIYDNRTHGITATGSIDSFDIGALYFESSYFSDAEHLTMYITDFSFIDKNRLYGEFDLKEKTITNIPEDISVEKMELIDNTLHFTLKVNSDRINNVSEPISSQYHDMDGNIYSFNTWTTNWFGDELNYYNVNYQLKDFMENKYKIRWTLSPVQSLEEPLIIDIK